MKESFSKMLKGYQVFREKYVHGDLPLMQNLSINGQKPVVMVIGCCDSRVPPEIILQCEPGDLFVVRNVANIVPPYEKDNSHHGTSAALEFAVCYLEVKHIIILGHSQCGGIEALLNAHNLEQNDFITNWVSVLTNNHLGPAPQNSDDFAKLALQQSYQNCLMFPWIKEKIDKQSLCIHLWFFDIKLGQIFSFSHSQKQYIPLDPSAPLN